MSYYLNLSFLSNNPDTRQKRPESRRQLSAEARRILSLCEGGAITEENIARDAAGRPFLINRNASGRIASDFSISHSGNLAAVSLVKGTNLRTGCDVEFARPRLSAEKIAEEYFSASEKEYINPHGKLNITRFYRIWTLKECYLKLRGLSVFDIARAPSFDCGANSFDASVSGNAEGGCVAASPLSFNLYEFSGGAGEQYILACAIEGVQIEQPEIRWFSQDSLVCRSIAKINAAISPAETVRPKI